MVWTSTKKSLENREVSFLAIVEIILAIYAYWAIAFYYDFYWHIILSITIAPVILLQSNKSNEMSLEIFFKFYSYTKIFFLTYFIIGFLIIRIYIDIWVFVNTKSGLYIANILVIFILLDIAIRYYNNNKNNNDFISEFIAGITLILLYISIYIFSILF